MEALGKRGEETLVAAESGRPLSPLLSESTDCRSGARRGSVVDEMDAHSVSALLALALSVLLSEVEVGAGDGDGDDALGYGVGGLARCKWLGEMRRVEQDCMNLADLRAPLGLSRRPLRGCFAVEKAA